MHVKRQCLPKKMVQTRHTQLIFFPFFPVVRQAEISGQPYHIIFDIPKAKQVFSKSISFPVDTYEFWHLASLVGLSIVLSIITYIESSY